MWIAKQIKLNELLKYFRGTLLCLIPSIEDTKVIIIL